MQSKSTKRDLITCEPRHPISAPCTRPRPRLSASLVATALLVSAAPACGLPADPTQAANDHATHGSSSGTLSGDAVDWAGVHWFIRNGGGGPGPNTWDPRNVWVDDEQTLHLKVAHRDGVWSCAELTSSTSFSFGRFQWWVEGPIDRLDPNVVLGLFTYPTSQVGSDGTNEIDIEMARWGNAGAPPLNYNVWPATLGPGNTSHASPMLLNGTYTTHRFLWASHRIDFTSVHGFRDDDVNPIATWAFAPSDPAHQVPQAPVPLHLNLWLFQGRPPTDGAEVEIKLHAFNYRAGG